MQRNYDLYLEDILIAAHKIVEFTRGLTYAQFRDDEKRSMPLSETCRLSGKPLRKFRMPCAKNVPRLNGRKSPG